MRLEPRIYIFWYSTDVYLQLEYVYGHHHHLHSTGLPLHHWTQLWRHNDDSWGSRRRCVSSPRYVFSFFFFSNLLTFIYKSIRIWPLPPKHPTSTTTTMGLEMHLRLVSQVCLFIYFIFFTLLTFNYNQICVQPLPP